MPAILAWLVWVIIVLVALSAVGYVAFTFIDKMGLDAPLAKLLKVAAGLILLLVLVFAAYAAGLPPRIGH